MFKKKKQSFEIKNLKIQLLHSQETDVQGIMAYFTFNGKKMDYPLHIKKKKGAPEKYYLKEAENRLNELAKANMLNTDKLWLIPFNGKTITAIVGALLCTIGISVGVTLAIVNAQSGSMVNVTFDAGIANFKDGARVKTFKVKKGTKLNDVPHDFPFIYADNDETLICSTRMWVTNDGTIVDETFGATNYEITSDVYLFADYRDDLGNTRAIAAGYLGSNAAEAIARQPEAENDILNTVETAFNWLNTADDGYEAIAIGTAASQAVDGIARQPEAKNQINDSLIIGYSNIRNMPNDSRNLGLGLMLGQVAEGIARQPYSTDAINNLANLVYREAKKCKSAASGYSIAYGAKQAIEGVARQPEAVGEIRDTILEAIDWINQSDDTYESFAIGKTLAQAAEAIARQPDASDKIRKSARISYSAYHSLPNDGRVDGLGETGSQAVDGIARQPEVVDDIISTTCMVYDAAKFVDNPLKGQSLGQAGKGAVQAVARQPDSKIKIRKALYYTIQEILKV